MAAPAAQGAGVITGAISTTRPVSLKRVGAGVAIALLACLLPACGVASGPSADIAAVYENAVGLSTGQADEQQRMDIALWEWAGELGVAEPFSLATLHRASGTSEQYGARGTSDWDRYRDEVEKVSQLIRDELRAGLTPDEVRAYYQRHPERFEAQDAMTIEVIEWEQQRAGAGYTVEIDAANVRTLQESDDAVISAALELRAGERVNVDRGDGRVAQLRCVSRTDGGVVPFEDVVQAASAQLADERFDTLLAERARLSGDR